MTGAAVAATESWLGAIQREAYLASAALAAEKGSFPLFERDRYLAGETVMGLDEDVRAAIAQQGIRLFPSQATGAAWAGCCLPWCPDGGDYAASPGGPLRH